MTAQSAILDANVLVLNRVFVAVRIISARRAFCLLCSDRAEVVYNEDGRFASYDFDTWTELSAFREMFSAHTDWVRTVGRAIAVPRIIRLLHYDRFPLRRVKLNRANIYARDRNTCQYCGRSFPSSELTLDHVVPRRLGGGSSWDNLVCCCVACNRRKGGRTPEQAHMRLIRKPERPKRHPTLTVRLQDDRYACWQAFLDNAYWTVELH